MRIATVLIPIALLTASCATSDYRPGVGDRSTLAKIKDSRLSNAPLAPAPRILPETHFAAARMFEEQGHVERAVEQYRKAIAVNHHYADAYHRLGLLLSKVSRHDEAIDAFARAVELEPRNAHFYNNFGFELMFEERWSEAERELREAIRLQPGLKRAQINLAMALSKMGRFDEALPVFLAVLPEPDAHYNMGLLYRGQQQYSEASRAFQHVLTLNPSFTAARTQLAEIAVHLEAGTPGHSAPRLTTDVPSPLSPATRSNQGAASGPSRERDQAGLPIPPSKSRDFLDTRPTSLAKPAQTSGHSPDQMTDIVPIIDNEVRCLRQAASQDASILNDPWSHATASDNPSVNDRVAYALQTMQSEEWGFTTAIEFIPVSSDRSHVATAQSFSPAEGVESAAIHSRPTGSDSPTMAHASPKERLGLSDRAATTGEPQAWKARLREIEGQLSSVRFEVDSLDKHEAALDRSAAGRPSKFTTSRMSLVSAPVVGDRNDSPTILREFARIQLEGAKAWLRKQSGSPTKSRVWDDALPRSVLVKDSIVPSGDHFADPAIVGPEQEPLATMLTSEFKALDRLASIVHNEIICTDLLKTEVIYNLTPSGLIESWLDPSLSPLAVEVSWLDGPAPANACRPGSEDASDSTTIGKADWAEDGMKSARDTKFVGPMRD